MYFFWDPKTGLIEQFRGYFDLYNIPFKYISLFDFTEKKSPLRPNGAKSARGPMLVKVAVIAASWPPTPGAMHELQPTPATNGSSLPAMPSRLIPSGVIWIDC